MIIRECVLAIRARLCIVLKGMLFQLKMQSVSTNYGNND